MFKSVLRHFMNEQEVRRIDTEFYPDPVSSRSKDDFPSRARGLIVNEIEKCTGCRECVEVCPTKCIHLESENIANSKKAWVEVFDLDFSNCIFCGKCIDVCNPNSLTQTKEIQSAVYDVKDLIKSFGRGKP